MNEVVNQTFYYSFNSTNEITQIEIVPKDYVGEISYTYELKIIEKLDDSIFQTSSWFSTHGGLLNCNDTVVANRATCYKPIIDSALNPYYKLFADFGYLDSPYSVPLKPFTETGGESLESPELC
ncbi:hypothetical protein [Allomuricauda sp. R78024]|uniref:hypothetical protein n=1 Tax=Allomuricauda sp. R78024 TaxID=3093867 RepID=UPI0037C4F014